MLIGKSANHIFLCGMPGSGKTTTGALLAQTLDFPFFDLDVLVASRAHNTIAHIFAEHGEDYFRQAEHAALEEFIARNASTNYVLALGGGTPCFHNNLALVKQNGILVYLECPLQELAQRLQYTAGERPLLQSTGLEAKLEALHNTRSPFYRQSDYVINATKTPQHVGDSIAAYIATL